MTDVCDDADHLSRRRPDAWKWQSVRSIAWARAFTTGRCQLGCSEARDDDDHAGVPSLLDVFKP